MDIDWELEYESSGPTHTVHLLRSSAINCQSSEIFPVSNSDDGNLWVWWRWYWLGIPRSTEVQRAVSGLRKLSYSISKSMSGLPKRWPQLRNHDYFTKLLLLPKGILHQKARDLGWLVQYNVIWHTQNLGCHKVILALILLIKGKLTYVSIVFTRGLLWKPTQTVCSNYFLTSGHCLRTLFYFSRR